VTPQDATQPGATAAATWRNWSGSHSFTPYRTALPGSEQELIATVQNAIAAGTAVRAAGTGHSFTPIVSTNGLLLGLDRVSGVLSTDAHGLRATALAGTSIADLGAPLWDAGLALGNQGDVDAQTIAGAVATGTKGSGTAFGTMSSTVRSARLITGTGDVVDVAEHDRHLLRAAQVSIGMLGVMSRLEVAVVPRYRLVEENRVMPFQELDAQWDELLASYRHFSFWWCPAQASSQLYDLGDVPAGHCVVKLLREAAPHEPDVTDRKDARTDRSHRIYPDGSTVAKFHELEYMVPADRAREAVDVLRHLQLNRFPSEISPLQVRWQQADDAYLSPQYGRDSTSLSVSGLIGTDYIPFLRAVDAALAPFDARPHWGKLHFLNADRVRVLYTQLEQFQEVRRAFDPRGLFLNPHLRALFEP